MSDLTILIIRHAEKPGELWPGSGLTAEGIQDTRSLVIRGWQRAGSWSALFGTGLNPIDYPKPTVIYAASPNASSNDFTVDSTQTGSLDEMNDATSKRPFETVTPLAARLPCGRPNAAFAVGQEMQLAAEIVNKSGVVLVAWEHKAIVKTLLPAIANGQNIPDLPTKWDKNRFDIVLRFDRAEPGALWSFRQLFPCLLSGDLSSRLT
ncbi:MAG: histidine phosphatase family protein [Verrucomicrobia bacterium]|nr:histidine phosphatase family protein [Verrucomicrobiota bacterium]MBV9674665.1 histidine phosphatase family protein [Verrucomicrobiota bacterium]